VVFAVYEGRIRAGVSRRVYRRNWDVRVGFWVVLVNIVGVIGGALPWSENGIPSIILWVEWEVAKSCRQTEAVAKSIETTQPIESRRVMRSCRVG